MVTTDELPPFEREVLSVVLEKLAPHGPDAAEVTSEWSDRAGMWFIEVAPRRTSGAPVSIGSDGDELLLQFGRTRVELWNYKNGPSPIDQLHEYLASIFGGHVEEAGSGDDRFARLELPNGKTASVGSAHLPLPWTWRRRHRYEGYS